MSGWDSIIEAKIAEAQRAGVFDNLPGAGKPLDLDCDRLVPEDVRMAYRILRNAGFVPVEIEERKEAADLRKLIAATTDHPERRRALAKLALLETRLEARGTMSVAGPPQGANRSPLGGSEAASAASVGALLPRASDYYAKLASKLARGR